MNRLRLLLAATAVGLALSFGVAHADPVTAFLTVTLPTMLAPVVGTTMAGVISWVAQNAVRMAGMSLLGQALSKKPKTAAVGIKTQTTTGGSVAQTFVLGRFATAGQLAAPLNTYGTDGKTPNAYLTYVIARGCIPGQQLSRLILNDDYVAIAGSKSPIGGSSALGYKLLGTLEDNAWINDYDGTQTAADPLLVEKFGGDPDRPWTGNAIGHGRPYAVLVFRYNREVLNSPPNLRFEEDGIPLYDPRDPDQSWADPSTWLTTQNPVIMIYNLHRGIRLPDGSVYGGEAAAEDLPLDNWIAAMNDCDEPVETDDEGGTEPRFTAGIEVSLSDEPADVMEALETACQAQQVEIGGVWKIRVGGPGLPVHFITNDDGELQNVFEDEDILVDRDRGHDMFPGLANTFNGIQGSHPLPSALWEMTDAPPRFNADWEADDDGRRLIADLNLPAVFSPTQAQRLMKSSIEEERRFRRHSLSMGPYASMLEPLDAIAWFSTSEGYTKRDTEDRKVGKTFEITGVAEGLRTLSVDLALRERDSQDFVWAGDDALPWAAAIPGTRPLVVQSVPDFNVISGAVMDEAGGARRPALDMTWTGTEMPDVRGLMYEVRLQMNEDPVTSGTVSDITLGRILIVEGILPDTRYQVRARLIVDRPTQWTAWKGVTTDDIRFDFIDLAESLATTIETPLDEVLKTNLLVQTYQSIQDGLNYTGDGRSLQFATLQAINKGQEAIDSFNLLGVLSEDRTAYVLNTSFARIGEGADDTLAGLISTVSTVDSTVSEHSEAIGNLRARYSLKVENISGGQKAIAGMVFDASNSTSSIGFYASKFFLADNSGLNLTVPFSYVGGNIHMDANVRITGDLVVDGTVTTEKLISNAVSNFNDDSFSDFSTAGTADEDCAIVPFIPQARRARISFRVSVAGNGERYAILIKIFRKAAGAGSYGAYKHLMGFVGDAAFSTHCTSYVYDFFDDEEVGSNFTYKLTVRTLRGTNIGDGTPGPGTSIINYPTTIEGGNMTIESMKR